MIGAFRSERFLKTGFDAAQLVSTSAMTEPTYYTNSNEVSQLLRGINERIPVASLEDREPDAEGDEDVQVCWFDILFYVTPEEPWTKERLLRRRPNEGPMIWELLTKHSPLYLFTYTWHNVIWNSHTQRIRFMEREPPRLENKVIYLLATQPLTFNARQEVESLFDAFAFAKTLVGRIGEPLTKSITCQDCHSYKALCDKLATLIRREVEEGDFWFDKTEALLYELEDQDQTRLTLDLDRWDDLKENHTRYDDAYKTFEAQSPKVRAVFDENE